MITVIITAYNRRDYLIHALKSALNQSLIPGSYEIVVVKNFQEKEVDELIISSSRLNNVKSILMEGTIGDFLYEGIMHSSGDILSFLDDDDVFLETKLEHVQKAFSEDDELVYYKHRARFMDKNGSLIDRIDKGPNFNLSTISVKKDIVYLRTVKKVLIGSDNYMFYNALDSSGRIKVSENILSFYRYHGSTTSTITSFERFLKSQLMRFELDVETTRQVVEDFKTDSVKRLCYSQHIGSKIRLSIFNSIQLDEKDAYISPQEIFIYLQQANLLKIVNILELILPKDLKRFLEKIHYAREMKRKLAYDP